ncbi:hypothetical protein PHMEG_00015563 [Phytophthora megakarya]|uniref:CCHC-type domain-containing protein n=1 Tax=Phytophthora megakarya TaxID=4795 RepID=A0A225W332_9STRA|nr:hypothetical protein PHMEG_00015563 [Phytophthora megakarya]
MARTKLVNKSTITTPSAVAGTGLSLTQNQILAVQTTEAPGTSDQTATGPAGGNGRSTRQDTGIEETKGNESADGNSSADEHEDREADADEHEDGGTQDATTSADMVPATTFAPFLQQLTTTLARMDARMEHLNAEVATLRAQQPVVATSTGQTTVTEQTLAPASVCSSTQRRGQQPPATTVPTHQFQSDTGRRVVHQAEDRDDGSPSSDSDDSNDSNDSNDDDGRPPVARQPATISVNRSSQRNRRRTIRDLDLPTFLPTPQTSVSTWKARVELMLTGARISGRVEWTDQELYYILGPKLLESAGRWWVQLDRKLHDRDRTWSTLKTSLTNQYGERPHKSMAEWRVVQRRMVPGETYADFAAALRDLCGNNRVKERVLLEQFYRSIDQTTRALVRQYRQKIRTLEAAVEKATEISDPIYNVAQGMEIIGQAFVPAPDSCVVRASGTTGPVAMIPGVGSGALDGDGKLALFTNTRGVYNKLTGFKRSAPVAAPTTTAARRTPLKHEDTRTKVNMAVAANQDLVVDTDDDDTEAGAAYEPSPVKKPKVTAQRTKAATRQAKGLEAPPAAAEVKSAFRRTNDGRCFACGALGHIAAYCTDPEARKRHEEETRQKQAAVMEGDDTTKANIPTVPVTVVDDKDVIMNSIPVPSNGKSRTAVRAVIARLKDELASRDGERAGREGGGDDDPGDGFSPGRGEVAQCAAVEVTTMANGGHLRCARSGEEGGVATSDVPSSEESVTVPAKSTASCGVASGELSIHALGEELTDEEFAKFGSVGKVRTAVKRSRRADKVRRDEVDREVAVLDDGQRERYGQERRAINGAQVKWVQRGRVETVSGVCNVVEASDGLPKATMLVDGKRQAVKIDSGARFTVAGTDWMLRGERVNIKSPVDFIEGIGGFLLDVVGVWRFSMKNVFGQWVTLDACIIDGCSHEFLIGVDFLEHRQANIDFKKNEVRYDVQGERVIIPFRTTDTHDGVAKAAVRLVNAAKCNLLQ